MAGSLFPSVPPVCPIAATAVENSTETAAAIAAKTTEDAASDQSDSANAASTTPEQLGGTCTCLLCPNGESGFHGLACMKHRWGQTAAGAPCVAFPDHFH